MKVLRRLVGIGPLEPNEFGQLYLELGRSTGVLDEPTFDADAFAVHDSGSTHYLSNTYSHFLTLRRRQREPYLRHVLRGHHQIRQEGLPDTWEDAAPKLLVRLRDAVFLDAIACEGQRRDATVEPLQQSLVDGLYLTLVLDSEQTMATVTSDMLDGWGKSFGEALTRARSNLLDVSLDPFVAVADGVWMAPWDDSYAASRATLYHLLQQVCLDPLVAVPARDSLLLARSRDDEALESLINVMNEIVKSAAYPITRRIYQLDKQQLVPFSVPREHAAAVLHQNLLAAEILDSYADQQRLLQEALGEDVYVASAEADEDPEGWYVSRAVWTQGVDTLLPQVDRVFLLESVGPVPQIWVAPWDKLVALPNALKQGEQLHPRWRTCAFPDAEQLQAIAVPLEQDRRTAELESGDSWTDLAPSSARSADGK